MKKTYRMMSMLLLTIALTSCSDDNDESKEVSFDSKYNISCYEEIPGVNEKQGYLVDEGEGGTKFIELEPQSSAPYTLLIVTRNQQGEEALNYFMENNGGVVLDKHAMGPQGEYLVVTTKYFESPYFFVSASYRVKDYSGPFGIRILPTVIVSMKEGHNVNAVRLSYSDVLLLQEDDYDRAEWNFPYQFNCSLNTSREVLRLCSTITQRSGVEWAEPDMIIPISY